MGCHTWFYKKIDVSITEARVNVVNQLYENIKIFEHFINGKLTDNDKDMLKSYPEWTPQYMISRIAIYNRQIDMINQGLCNVAVMNKYDIENLTTYIDDKGIYKEVEFHDIFRKYGYPDDKLYSLEETINYIKNVINKCDLYQGLDETIKKLEEFWNKYPNGMIEFG